MENKYLLFGREVCDILFNEDIHAVIQAIEDCNISSYDTYVLSPNTNPLELLSEYDGWDGYAVISEEEFNLINGL
jgi:hypothetical protein